MIFCGFRFCVFNKDEVCKLKSINVSNECLCEDCHVEGIGYENLEKFIKESLEKRIQQKPKE